MSEDLGNPHDDGRYDLAKEISCHISLTRSPSATGRPGSRSPQPVTRTVCHNCLPHRARRGRRGRWVVLLLDCCHPSPTRTVLY